jgi:hypothetical protein
MFHFIGVNEQRLFNTGACFFCSSTGKDAAAASLPWLPSLAFQNAA